MPHIGVFSLIVIAASASLVGWGWIASEIVKAPKLPAALTAATGLAVLIFVGGILNLVRLALPLAIDGLVLAGFLAACFFLGRFSFSKTPPWPRGRVVTLIAVFGAAFLAVRYLTPQKTFNWNDDFERYFSYPVRMLQTGTVGGNPLGYVGVDTLGAQAFLQAFVVRHLPIHFIGAIETSVCLPLCLLMAGCFVSNWRSVALAISAQLVVLALDPQIVNVSSVYGTSALVMAACFLGRFALGQTSGIATAILPGLAYAGLIALKTTNLAFVAFHFAALLIADITVGSGVTNALKKGGRLAVFSFLFLLPWLTVHVATYAAAIGARVSAPSTNFAHEPFNLFSTAIPFFGVPQLYFTLAVLGGLLLCGLSWFVSKKQPPSLHAAYAGIAAGVACAACYLALVVVLAPLIFGQEASNRYCGPILNGAIPAVIVLVGEIELKSRVHFQAVALAVGVGIVALFWPSLSKRFHQVTEHGSLLAFTSLANTPIYLSNHRDVLDGKAREIHGKIQALVPAGEPMIVWTQAPFWLNFARNPIYNTSQHGLGMPRKTFPKARYIAWQYQSPALLPRERYYQLLGAAGAGDRVSAARTLEFIDTLERYAQTSDILYNDGEYALIRLRE